MSILKRKAGKSRPCTKLRPMKNAPKKYKYITKKK